MEVRSPLDRRACPCLALVAALVVSLALACWGAGPARAETGYPAAGPYCFSISNGGWGDFNNDGFEVRHVGIDSFQVVVRWQKSVLCPLPGTLEVYMQPMTGRWEGCYPASKVVYSNGGHYENWITEIGHDVHPSAGGCTSNNFEYLVPGVEVRVWVNLSYLGYHETPKHVIRLADDPATNLGDVEMRADRKTIVLSGKPRNSLYGVSKVAWSIRDPEDPTSKFNDGIVEGYTCAPGPVEHYGKREIKGCWHNPETGIEKAPSESPKVCPGKTPCRVPLQPGHVYEVRELVDNSFSGRTWGPVKRIKTDG